MLLFALLAGCSGPIADHCVTTSDPSGELRELSIRDMKAGRLEKETLYFSLLGDPVATATNLYDGDLWTNTEFDGFPDDEEPTRQTQVTYDEVGRPLYRLSVKISDGTQEEFHAYTWDGDRVSEISHETLFTTWDEVFEWDGDTATVTQTYFGGRVIVEIRSYEPSPLSWPVLDPDLDLPGLAFTSIGVDDNDNGMIEDSERVWEQDLDADGIPTAARFYDATGSLFSSLIWGDCPVLGEE